MYSKTFNTLTKFLNNRIVELMGIFLIIFSICLLLAILTYSPDDPNLLYTPENKKINNLLGLRGSIVIYHKSIYMGFEACKSKIYK